MTKVWFHFNGTKNVALIYVSPYLYDSKVAPSTSVQRQLFLGGFFPQGVVDATIYHRNVGHHGWQKGAMEGLYTSYIVIVLNKNKHVPG